MTFLHKYAPAPPFVSREKEMNCPYKHAPRLPPLTLNSQDLISNSPYCLPYNCYDVNLENLVLNQPTIP